MNDLTYLVVLLALLVAVMIGSYEAGMDAAANSCREDEVLWWNQHTHERTVCVPLDDLTRR